MQAPPNRLIQQLEAQARGGDGRAHPGGTLSDRGFRESDDIDAREL